MPIIPATVGAVGLVAIAVAVLAVGGLALSLIGRRPDGRRRCPRCWHEMTGTESLTCAECGRIARSEKRLHRPKRRWRSAVASALVLAVASLVAWGDHLGEAGIARRLPGPLLVLTWPHAEWAVGSAEIRTRIEDGTLGPWSTRRLADACLAVITEHADALPPIDPARRFPSPDFGPPMTDRDPASAIEGLWMLTWMEIGHRFTSKREPWGRWSPVVEHRPDAPFVAARLLDHPIVEVRTGALDVIRLSGPRAAPLLPRLLEIVVSPWQREADLAWEGLLHLGQRGPIAHPRFAGAPPGSPMARPDRIRPSADWIESLAVCGTDVECMEATFVDGLADDTDADVRRLSIRGLTILAGAVDASVLEPILDLAGDPDPRVRSDVVSASASLPLDERVIEVLGTALLDEPAVALHAMESLRARRDDVTRFLPVVREAMLAQTDPEVRVAATWTFIELGGDAGEVLTALVEIIESGRGLSSFGLMVAISRLELDRPAVVERLEPLLDAAPVEQRCIAAALSVRLGGDRARSTTVVFEAHARVAAAGDRAGERFARQWAGWLGSWGLLDLEVAATWLHDERAGHHGVALAAIRHAAGTASMLDRVRELAESGDGSLVRNEAMIVARSIEERQERNARAAEEAGR